MIQPINNVLIANRGEIAIRIARSANELGFGTVAVYSKDDANSLHVTYSDRSVELPGTGVKAYLNIGSIIDAAISQQCDAIHPGYGLLSESAELAKACEDKGLVFIGPDVSTLQGFGDKISARHLAKEANIPVIEGNDKIKTAADVLSFFQAQGEAPIMLKAVNGGGGRGMRVIKTSVEIDNAFVRCQAESIAAFGSDALYVERFLPSVRHIEVQIVGDGQDVVHLWERDCTLQRRNQKLVELAPAPNLNAKTRERLLQAAVRLGQSCHYKGLGTVEFLVEVSDKNTNNFEGDIFFIETNPRIQVEHTVTEAITGLDLVALQLRIAAGATLRDIGLSQADVPNPQGFAIQARINTETLNDQGALVPTGGIIEQLQLPGGLGIRIDTYAYAGYQTNPNFDSLLAKLIVHSPADKLGVLLNKTERALSEFYIKGLDTNVNFLRALLCLPELQGWKVSVQAIESKLAGLYTTGEESRKKRYLELAGNDSVVQPALSRAESLDHPEEAHVICSPLQSVLVAYEVEVGQEVREGDELAVVEAMKMQHVITAPCAGEVLALHATVGDTLYAQQAVVVLQEVEGTAETLSEESIQDLDHIRLDLQALNERLMLTLDNQRPAAVAKRHQRQLRTARENIADLCDDNSFLEYGQLVHAAQRRRRPKQELMTDTPADGIITGVGTVNGEDCSDPRHRVAVLSYDATVMAGTQGFFGHKKTDRVLEMATELELPIIFFTEGGGGRPGDTDFADICATGLDLKTFGTLAKHRGRAPNIAINSGFCFAGNAALFGCCDFKITTEQSWIGMGGPAMIEGGGLGSYSPKDIGAAPMHARRGLIDVLAKNEADAVNAAKRLFSYFQGPAKHWESADQRALRHCVPEDRKRVYDVYTVIDQLVDTDSFLETKRQYGQAMITGFVRIEGRPLGLIANNPKHLGGALNAEASDKAARQMQLCNHFNLPVLSLCDTPGFMVGPDSEKEGGVDKASEMMAAGATLSTPVLMVCLRKGYGLGAVAMAGGSFSSTAFSISWPTGEFGGMGLEGGVRLGFKKELEAEKSPEARQALFDKLVHESYEAGSAMSVASFLEIDAVIDPKDTRHWIARTLDGV